MSNRRGFSLLLSLLVLSAILITVLSASTLILRELRISGEGVKGVQAFYVAESGLEDALFELRQKGSNGDALKIEYSDRESVGNGKFWRDVTQTTTDLKTTLFQNQVIETPLFDLSVPSNRAQSYKLTWESNPDVCPGGDYTWIEVVQAYWGLNPKTNHYESISERQLCPKSYANDCSGNIKGDFPYLRIRALFGDACNLSISADDKNFNLPAQLQVTARGEVGGNQQALTITVPTKAAQFGAFDYTIFSEQSICKGLTEEECNPPTP